VSVAPSEASRLGPRPRSVGTGAREAQPPGPAATTARSRPSAGPRVFRIALALFLVVAVARIQDVVPVLASLRPGKVLTLTMLVAVAVALPRWQLFSALRSTAAKCVAVIAALGVLSIPLSIWPSNSAAFFANSLTPSLVLFVVASAGFADRPTASLCVLTLVLSVGADAVYLLTGLAPSIAGRVYIGEGLDPNESAALFVTTLPFAMLLAPERGGRRWLGLAVAALLVAAVVKTGSRGGVVGLLVVALILILRAGPRRRWAYILGAAVGAGVFVLAADEKLLARFQTIFTPGSDYNVTDREGRLPVWTRGMGYMMTHPVFGVGLDGFETAEGVLSGKVKEGFGIGKVNEGFGIRYTAAHNAFVQIGAELGVIGLSAFILALWSAARGCRRIELLATRDLTVSAPVGEQEARLAAAAYCALVGIAATGFFLSLAYHPITLFALAVCVGVCAGSPYAARGPAQRGRVGRPAGSRGAVARAAADGFPPRRERTRSLVPRERGA
jgi:O-antigen ligase